MERNGEGGNSNSLTSGRCVVVLVVVTSGREEEEQQRSRWVCVWEKREKRLRENAGNL